MRDATLVTTQPQLDAAVFRLESAARLAIDTEFMRERTYYPQLCLVQVATDSDCYLVDPLAGLDLDSLHGLLADRSKLKILHAARQDIEVLQLGGRAVPAPVSTRRSPQPCSASRRRSGMPSSWRDSSATRSTRRRRVPTGPVGR
jgi:hypothetical protein